MSKIIKQDTNGIKPLLQTGEFGYDNYPGGGDAGRVFVGTGTENIGLAKKTEVVAVDSKADTHISRTDNPHSVTKAQVGLGNVDNTADADKNVLSAAKLTTARVIELTGDVTGSVSFDGSATASIATAIAANSVALGTDTTGNYVAGNIAGTGIAVTGTAGEGWSPTISIDSTVATLTGAQTLTNKTLQDSTTFIVDNTDATKKVQFDVAGITTATTRTMTIPNVNGTIITTGDIGTITSAMIADGTLVNADINASAGIVDTKLATIATAGKVSNSATTATSSNVINSIVSRNALGDFNAGTITASLAGNAATADKLNITELAGSVDLDTITTTGWYSQTSSPEAASGTNYPLGLAGLLEVFSYGSMIHQRYWVYNSDDIYLRAKYTTGAWTTWSKQANLGEVVGKVTSTDNAIVRFDGTSGTVQDSGVTIDDNNNITIPGRIAVGSSATVSPEVNAKFAETYTADTATKHGIYNTLTLSNSVPTGNRVHYGFNNQAISEVKNGSVYTNSIRGAYNVAKENAGSNSLTYRSILTGSYNYALVGNTTDSTYKYVADAHGAVNTVSLATATGYGIIDKAYGSYNQVSTDTTSPNGAKINTAYGVYITNDKLFIDTNYGLYQATTDISNYFASDVSVPVITQNVVPNTAITASATLSGTQMKNFIVNIAPTVANITLTLHNGANMDAAFHALAINQGFEWVIMVGAGTTKTTTIAGSTGHTVVGDTLVPATVNATARFCTRKTATNTFITYRIG